MAVRLPSLVGLFLAAALLAGCAGAGDGDGADDDAATPGTAGPAAEAGIIRGTLTATEDVAQSPLAIANAGHGRLAAMLVLVTNLPSTHIALNVSGPSGQSTEVDTGPTLYALPGGRPAMAFDAPAVGTWMAEVRLENGVSADYEVHWCADSSDAPGPQENLACHRDY